MIVYFRKKSKIIKKWGICGLCLLLGLYSLFVWGQILKKELSTIQIYASSKDQIVIDVQNSQKVEASTVSENSKAEYLFVASSRGKYYYPKDCSKAKSLSIKNMLYFKDKMSAETAGYVAHLGC